MFFVLNGLSCLVVVCNVRLVMKLFDVGGEWKVVVGEILRLLDMVGLVNEDCEIGFGVVIVVVFFFNWWN